MSSRELSLIFWGIGLLLAVVSMVLGPLGWKNASIACAAIAIVMGLCAAAVTLRGWKPPARKDPPDSEE